MPDFKFIAMGEEEDTSELEQEILRYDEEIEYLSADFMVTMLKRWKEDIEFDSTFLQVEPEVVHAIEELYQTMCENLTND